MKTWIWTFGVGTPYKGKYVRITTNNDDGREYMFKKYGQQNCCMSYPEDIGQKFIEKYHYECLEDISIVKIKNNEQNKNVKLDYSTILEKYILNAMSYIKPNILAQKNVEDFIGEKDKVVKHDWKFENMEDNNGNNNN